MKQLLTLLALALSAAAVAQEQRPGYIINTQGDTLLGQLEYRNWSEGPERIKFTYLNSDPVWFTPRDLKGFGTEGDHFVSAVVSVEKLSSIRKKATDSLYLGLETDTVLLQVLIKGPKSLYQHLRGGLNQYFYIQLADSVALLRYKENVGFSYHMEQKIQGLDAIHKPITSYQYQLQDYLGDSPFAIQKLAKTTYTRSSLMHLFATYYSGRTPSPSFVREVEKIKTSFAVLIGANATTVSFQSTDKERLNKSGFGISLNPLVGVQVELNFPHGNRQFSLVGEVVFTAMGWSGSYQEITNSAISTAYTNSFSVNYLDTRLILKYKFKSSPNAWYGLGGFGYSYGFIQNNLETWERRYFGDRFYEAYNFIQTTNTSYGFLAGLGKNWGPWLTELRFAYLAGFSGSTQGMTHLQGSLVVGYQF